MAGFGAFQFAAPSSYGDWATYAGFNRNTGEIDSAQAPQQGVKPPEDMQQYMSQRFAPVQSKITGIAPAMAQASQGNFVQAMGTMRSGQQQPQQSQQAPAVDVGYDYTHGL